MYPSEAVEPPSPDRAPGRARTASVRSMLSPCSSDFNSPTGSEAKKDFFRMQSPYSACGPADISLSLGAEIDALLTAQHERLLSEILQAVERSFNEGTASRLPRYAHAGSAEGLAEVGSAAGETNYEQATTNYEQSTSSDFAKPWKRWSRKQRESCTSLDKEDAARERKARSVHSVDSVTPSTDDTLAKRILSSPLFEGFLIFAIITNSLLIGAEVEYLAHNHGNSVPVWIYAVTHTYTALFCLELVARIAVQRASFFCAEDWVWNSFDVAVVTSSLVELGVDIVNLLNDSPSDQVQSISNFRMIRVLRITRLIRTVRVARIVRFITALRLLVLSILATLRSLVWAVVLMAIIVYIFAIVFTQSATDSLIGGGAAAGADDGCPGGGGATLRYWGSLGVSMFTLFQSITGGLSWEVAVEPLGRMSWTLVGLFILYVFTINFAVLNVITGFFCTAATDAAFHDPEVIVQSMLSDEDKCEAQITKLFNSLDTHGTGKVTYLELRRAMKDKRVQAHFKGLNVDIADTWTLFKLINSSKTNLIDLEEFIMGCMRLKGNAKSVHIEKLMSDHRWFMKKFSTSMRRLEIQLGQIALRIHDLEAPGGRPGHSQHSQVAEGRQDVSL